MPLLSRLRARMPFTGLIVVVSALLLSSFARAHESVPSELLRCIREAEVAQKSGAARAADQIENALTRLRVMLPIDELPQDQKLSVCGPLENIETTSDCGYGAFEKNHPKLATLNRYSIGPYQIRPSLALKFEAAAAHEEGRPPRTPRAVVEDLLTESKARSSVEAYLRFLKSRVAMRFPDEPSLGVWATWYNEGQIDQRLAIHGARILTRVNRFGRFVEKCAGRKPLKG